MNDLVIDLSKYNTVTDWNSVKRSVSGVIIRAGYRGYTSGIVVEDKKFVEFANACRNHDIPFGVYFMSQAINEVEAIQEANHAINLSNMYGATLPIFIDSEDGDGTSRVVRADGLSKEARTKVVLAFLDTVANSGRLGGTYASESWFCDKLNYDAIKHDLIWVAKYGKNNGSICSIKLPKYNMHQYTSNGTIAGVNGRCDVSVTNIRDLIIADPVGSFINNPETHTQLNYQPNRSYVVSCNSLRVRTKPAIKNGTITLGKQIGSLSHGAIVVNKATMRLDNQIFMYLGLDNRGREQWVCADNGETAYIR